MLGLKYCLLSNSDKSKIIFRKCSSQEVETIEEILDNFKFESYHRNIKDLQGYWIFQVKDNSLLENKVEIFEVFQILNKNKLQKIHLELFFGCGLCKKENNSYWINIDQSGLE